jgi:demethoxyubiquinone hydroxylase (CLK1/Coq7/Cat5 family)
MEYDTGVIRPEMRVEQVRARGSEFDGARRARVRRGLRTLHTVEIMATNIYKCQIGNKQSALNTQLTAAMCNEMTHMQDFQTKLYEHGFKPSRLRWTYWVVGYAFGLGSRMLGTRQVLKTAIWTEEKAVHHYGRLLAEVEWDDDTRVFIEKDRADEVGHVARWRRLLDHPEDVR